MMKTLSRILLLLSIVVNVLTACSKRTEESSAAFESSKDSTALAAVKGAEMDFYEIYRRQRESNNLEGAVHAAETFLNNIDSTVCHPIVAEMSAFLGRYYTEESRFSKSIYWHDRALKIYSAAGIPDSVHAEQMNLSRSYFRKNRYDLALKYVLPALKFYEENSDTTNMLPCYNLLGGIYYSCNDAETAMEYYKKLKANAKAVKDTIQTVVAINNISLMAEDRIDIKGTQELIKESIRLCAEVKDTLRYTKMLFCLTATYVNSADLENLEKILPEIIGLEDFMKKPYDMAQYHYNLGAVYKSLGRYEPAARQFEAALENYQKGEYLQYELFCYGMLYDIYEKLGERDKAYETLLKFVTTEKNTESIDTYIQLFRYQNELIIKEKQELLHEKKNQSQKIFMLVIFFVVMAIVIVFFLFRMKASRIKQKEKELKNTVLEQEKKSQEIKSQNEILELHRMQQFQLDRLAKDLVEKLRKVSRNSSEDQTKEEIDAICQDLRHSFESDSNWQELNHFIPEFNSEFFQNLLKDFPELTINERRLCALLNMNMTTKEISGITKQSVHSINVARGRLRAKLGLTGSNASIQEFLARYGRPEE